MELDDDFINIIDFKLGLKKVLSTKEVADCLDLHVETLFRMRKRGEGPNFFLIGRKIKYMKSDVIDWIKKTQIKYM